MCPLLTSLVVLGVPNLNTSKTSLTLAVALQVQPSVMDRKVLKGIPQWIPVVASSSGDALLRQIQFLLLRRRVTNGKDVHIILLQEQGETVGTVIQ